ncbi:MAG: Jag N-terminal domain-containing protein [Elusimicrobiales bacterium]|jgi:spoIIIJ-associated protein
MKETKVEAKTIQDAVEIGLIELGLRRDQVEVVVVSEGTKGFLGLGAKKACVTLREKKWTGSGHHEERDTRRERPSSGRGRNNGSRGSRRERYEGRPRPARPSQDRPQQERRPDAGYERRPDAVYQDVSLAMDAVQAPEDPADHAKLALTTTLKLMGLEASVTDAGRGAEEGVVSIKFDSPDSAVFTAENARGLQSLQFLVNSIINKNRKNRVSVRIDTADYWNKKEEELAAKIESVVKEVVGTARPYRLEPMSAPLRKFVHSLIKTKYPEVETLSEGEGKWRKVVIRPVTRQEAAK